MEQSVNNCGGGFETVSEILFYLIRPENFFYDLFLYINSK